MLKLFADMWGECEHGSKPFHDEEKNEASAH